MNERLALYCNPCDWESAWYLTDRNTLTEFWEHRRELVTMLQLPAIFSSIVLAYDLDTPISGEDGDPLIHFATDHYQHRVDLVDSNDNRTELNPPPRRASQPAYAPITGKWPCQICAAQPATLNELRQHMAANHLVPVR